MIYKINIKNRKIYLKPRPKEDIKDGLVIVLNKPISGKLEPFMTTNIRSFKKEYNCPDLPPEIFIKSIFVKNVS
jgi:hypothetical protein